MADLSSYGTVTPAPPGGGGAAPIDLSSYGTIDKASAPTFTSNLTDTIVGAPAAIAHSVLHPIDTLRAWRDQSQALHDKAVDAAEQGDYEAAAVHGINFLANIVPGLGTAMDEAASAKTPEEFRAKLGNVVGAALLMKAPGMIKGGTEAAVSGAKATAGAVADAAGKLKDVASHPAAGAVVDAIGMVHPGMGHAFNLVKRGVKVIDALRESFGAEAEPETPVDPLLDQLSKQFYNAKFESLDPKQASAVQSLADAANGKKASAAPSEPPAYVPRPPEYYGVVSAPIAKDVIDQLPDARTAETDALARSAAPSAEPVTPAPALDRAAAPTTSRPRTLIDDLDAYLAQRRAERAALAPPAEPPEAPPPGNTAPTPPPPSSPGTPGAAQPDSAPAAFTDTETTGLQIPRVANARAAIVNNMADYFHKGGMKAADLEARRSQPAAWDLLWKNAAKVSGSKQGAAYTPSADTISATIDRLETLEKAKAMADDARSALEDQLVESLTKVRGKRGGKATVGDLMGK